MLLERNDVLAAEAEFYARSFKEFVRAAWGQIDPAPFVDNWHVDAICDHLQAVGRQIAPHHSDRAGPKLNRLLINVPPGCAKSMLVGVLFPAWLWTRRPECSIISVGHSITFATRDTRKCREVIRSAWFQARWPMRMSEDQDKKTSFLNDRMGFRECAALSGATGSRCNVLLTDDPHSVDGAKSEADRHSTVETFLEALPNRINDIEADAIIVIMQRLHEEDVSGAILERPDMGFCHLRIPMEFDGDYTPTAIGWVDPRATEGELMFPAKFPEAAIRKLKASQGPYVFEGQYNQRPTPKNDGFFRRDWFHFYRPDDLPKNLTHYLTSDFAVAGTADFNVIQCWGVDVHGHLWLVDQFRKQCLSDEALGVMMDGTSAVKLRGVGALPMIRKYAPLCWFPEKDSNWSGIKSFADRFMLATDTFCRVEPVQITKLGDKMGRAQAFQGMASLGLVHIPHGDIGSTLMMEFLSFPRGKRDDQVDAAGLMGRVIGEANPAYIAPMPDAEPEEDYLFGERVPVDSGFYW